MRRICSINKIKLIPLVVKVAIKNAMENATTAGSSQSNEKTTNNKQQYQLSNKYAITKSTRLNKTQKRLKDYCEKQYKKLTFEKTNQVTKWGTVVMIPIIMKINNRIAIKSTKVYNWWRLMAKVNKKNYQWQQWRKSTKKAKNNEYYRKCC